ncbi:hypothetical protein DRE_00214 [Drechslerella stenobrocha 248]|uniref:Uncharacterized protein n=1 Tax=Drechslerella stenobrocha 248 TaxID=1043628 RepID=W7HZG9_9PEZI|nr:hypothetical protein DRE_00214 [Drechslerella stenobrocha 248]
MNAGDNTTPPSWTLQAGSDSRPTWHLYRKVPADDSPDDKEYMEHASHMYRRRGRLANYLAALLEAPGTITRFALRSLKQPAIALLVGLLVGIALTRSGSRLSLPTSSSSRHVGAGAKNAVAAWTEDFYFYPPLDQKRHPPVLPHNVLDETSAVIREAHRLIQQTPLTPLFVPFTRNGMMLHQTVSSYIAAGWPREQIYVIDNSGTMDANARGRLSETNPFFLNYTLLRGQYGVNVVRTPTLLTFSQLQNYLLATAMGRGWKYFYWTHQDVAALSDETAKPFRSLYENVVRSLIELHPRADLRDWTVETLAAAGARDEGRRSQRGKWGEKANVSGRPWGLVWYEFDWLTLVNVAAAADEELGVGAWDTFIPYYHTDCDYYERMRLRGFAILEPTVGLIYDLSLHFNYADLAFFGDGSPQESSLGSARFSNTRMQLEEAQRAKNEGERNTWQDEFTGGAGEPWTYNPTGFQDAWWHVADAGRETFVKKWRTLSCRPGKVGRTLDDMWRVRTMRAPKWMPIMSDPDDEDSSGSKESGDGRPAKVSTKAAEVEDAEDLLKAGIPEVV